MIASLVERGPLHAVAMSSLFFCILISSLVPLTLRRLCIMSRLQYPDVFSCPLYWKPAGFVLVPLACLPYRSIQPLSPHLMFSPVRRIRILCTILYARAITPCACGAPRARDREGVMMALPYLRTNGDVTEPLRGESLSWSAPSHKG